MPTSSTDVRTRMAAQDGRDSFWDGFAQGECPYLGQLRAAWLEAYEEEARWLAAQPPDAIAEGGEQDWVLATGRFMIDTAVRR